MDEQDTKRKNSKKTDQLSEAKKQKIETKKPEGNLDFFLSKLFTIFAIFQQIIEEVIKKIERKEQEGKVKIKN